MHKGDKAKSEVDEINSMLKAISHNGGARTEILRERRRSKEQSDKESLATKATESLATQDTAHKFDKHHLHHIDVSIPHHGADALTGAASRGVRAAALQRLSRAAAKVGGTFLTEEQWAAIRTEMGTLKDKNRRLLKQLEAERSKRPFSDPNDSVAEELSSPPSSPSVKRALSQALATLSPMGKRSSLSKCSMPQWTAHSLTSA